MKGIAVSEIAELLNGIIDGSPDSVVMGVSKIDQPLAGSLSFLSNLKYEAHIYTAKLGAVLVPKNFKPKHSIQSTLIRVADPYLAFCKVLNTYYNPGVSKVGIDDKALVSKSAVIDAKCYVGPGAVVGDNVSIGPNTKVFPGVVLGDAVTIGANCLLYPNVTIYHDCRIGDHTIIHSGTTIGSDGFGHAPLEDGSYQKIPQIGNVIIGNHVEIGANCAIDRATMGSTVIEDGVRLDNLIQVAHNVTIKKNTVIAAQTGVSGSTTIEANCVIGGQVGFAGHITVAPSTTIGAQSGVTKSVKEPGLTWYGTPLQLFKDELRSQAIYRDLVDLKKEVETLKAELNK